MSDAFSIFLEQLKHHRPVDWAQLPDFPLYMDQILSYMDRQLIPTDEPLTAAMINNYTKSGLVPRADGKKYNREHIAYLTAVCALKRVMSTKDIDLVMRQELAQRGDAQNGYEIFCQSLDKSLTATAQEVADYPNSDQLADAAIHFALMSYAAGVASQHYVNQLRSQSAPPQKEKNRKKLED